MKFVGSRLITRHDLRAWTRPHKSRREAVQRHILHRLGLRLARVVLQRRRPTLYARVVRTPCCSIVGTER